MPDGLKRPEYRTVGYAGRSHFVKKVAKKILFGTAGEPKDTNPLILLSLALYARDEPAFLARHEAAVSRALAYLARHTRGGLLWQEDHEDWLDVYGRQGQVHQAGLDESTGDREREMAEVAPPGGVASRQTARTATSDPEWKYVNLRRYFIYLEHSIDKGTQWAVFEPNGLALWRNVRRSGRPSSSKVRWHSQRAPSELVDVPIPMLRR